MRLPSVLNWTLLGINTLVFLLLLMILLTISGWLRAKPTAHRLMDGGAVLGMEVYYEMGPFVLLTGKDFPRDNSFQLMQRCPPLNPSMSVLDGKYFAASKEATKHVSMDVAPDFSISCECSLAGGRVDISDLMLGHKAKGLRETLTDINVDGVFDVRQISDEEGGASRLYVSYQGIWREVMGGDKDPTQDEFHKQLLDGTRVSFDMQSGRWLSSTDNPADNNDKATDAERKE
jgi:hypothetical protein